MTPDLDPVVLRATSDVLGLDPGEVRPESHIINDLGGSSLEVLEIVARLEDQYAIAIPDEALADLSTVRSVVDLLRAHLPHDGTAAPSR
jgi:acyl carrier protein